MTHSCRRRPLCVPLFLTLAFITACHLARSEHPSSNSASPTGNSSSHNTAFSPSGDAPKDLRDALERLNTAYPYRLTEESSSSGPGPEKPEGTRVVEFAAADRFHVKWTNGPRGDAEIITIGDEQYSRLNNGNWTVGSPAGFAQRQDMEKRMRELMRKAVKDVQYIGTDTINGVPCHAYTYTMGMDVSGQHWTGAGKALIGSSDGLLHQLYSETMVGSYKQKSNITYEYKVDFKVEKPVM